VKLTVTDELGQTDTVARTILVVPLGTEYEGIIKNPDTFVFASSANIPSSLDLYDITSPTSGRQMNLVLADTLLFQDRGEVEPGTERGLANSYEISSDGLHYTFKLKEGVEFWNGDELTSEDVEYTFERILALTASKLEWSVTFERWTGISRLDVANGVPVPRDVIESAIEAVDKYTVRFNFVEAYAPFLRSLTNTGWGIIQKEHAIENGAWSWDNPTDYAAIDGVDEPMQDGDALMCTGPYQIIEWSKGERILFERHEDYWEKTPSIKYVRYFSVPEFSTRKILMENGDVDGLSISAVTEFEQLLGRPGIKTVVSKYRGFLEAVGLGINFDPNLAPPENQVPSDFFADVHMRRAFAYALPYERYVEEVWLGYAEPARGVLPLGWPGAFENYPYTHDLEKAEEELKLAHGGKYWEEGFQVVGGHQAWAENTHAILYRMWAEEFAKIDPKFKVMSVSARYGDMMRMPIGMWIGTIDMDPIAYRSYMHSESWSSYYGYNNPEVDRLIEASTYTPFMEERLPLLQEAAEIVADEVPFLFTVHPAYLGAFSEAIDGFWYPIDAVVDAGYWPDLTKGE
jgi:peptide/nickel transport system substrate-binding protein